MTLLDPNEMIAARIDASWSTFDIRDRQRFFESPALTVAIQRWSKSRRAGFVLFKVTGGDLTWNGRGETPAPGERPTKWKRMFLVDMRQGYAGARLSFFWAPLL